MATVYSGYSGGWKPSGSDIYKKYRARLDYDIAVYQTYCVVTAYTSVNLNSSVNGSYTASMSIGGNGYSGSGKTVFKEGNTVTLIGANSVVYYRTTYAYDVGISGSVKSSSGSWTGAWVTASAAVTVPALSYHTVAYDMNSPKHYTLSGENGNKTVTPSTLSSQTKWDGINILLSSTVPTCDNYTFQGWSTSRTGSVIYAPGATYSTNTTGTVTLFAIWQPISYTLTYNYNEAGKYRSSSQSYSESTTSSISLPYGSTLGTFPSYSLEGYSLSSWNTQSDNSGITVTSTGSYISENLIIYAQWTERTYTITYSIDSNIGSIVSPAIINYYYWTSGSPSIANSNKVNLNSNLREFYRWNTNLNDSGTAYAAGSSYPYKTNIILYAIAPVVYSQPTISNLVAIRIDDISPYKENTAGIAGQVTFNCNDGVYSGTAHSISSYTTTYICKYKEQNISTYVDVTLLNNSGANSPILFKGKNNNLPVDLAIDKIYDVQLTATTTFILDDNSTRQTSTTSTTYIGKAVFAIDITGDMDGIAFGGVAPDEQKQITIYDRPIVLEVSQVGTWVLDPTTNSGHFSLVYR